MRSCPSAAVQRSTKWRIVRVTLLSPDDSSNDWVERRKRNGDLEMRVDHEHVQRSNLRIDTRKWLLAKLQPEKYSDRIALTGHDGGPLAIQVVRYDLPAQLPCDGAKVVEHVATPQVVDKSETSGE